jgi:hypothetical protein
MSSAPLLGSYKLSLLGKMPASSKASHQFTLVFSYPSPSSRSTTATLRVPFEASFYDLQSPWVATVDLNHGIAGHSQMDQSIQVARKGQLTLIIKNEFETPIRLLLFPYDLRKLPASSTVLLRRVWYVGGKLKYAVHMQFASVQVHEKVWPAPPADTQNDDVIFDLDLPQEKRPRVQRSEKHLLLFREIKLVFASSSPDPDEEIRVESEGLDNVFPWAHWPTRMITFRSETPPHGSSLLSAMSLPED